MKELPSINFGLIIAFLLPGFVALVGISFFSGPVKQWLGTEPQQEPTSAGFFLVILASLALGLLISAVRWAIVDTIHHKTGIQKPNLDFSKLKDNMEAYIAITENHYKYYQYYSNMFIALLLTYFSYTASRPELPWYGNCKLILILGFIELVLFWGSRDALDKTYKRTKQILGEREEDI